MNFKVFILNLLVPFGLASQVFDNGIYQSVAKRGADHVYNANVDSAMFYADSLEVLLPKHPAAPLIRAMALLWAHIPTISDEVFMIIEQQLDSTVLLAKAIDSKLKNPEMMFFAMAAYGLLAEYYADRNFTMKAFGEASKAYGLLKKGFDYVEEYPEYLFAIGLYNYFREKYPERHPIYTPLLWFFRSGDRELGLKQLEKASEVTFLTKVEALLYLSYIYLRYEFQPKKAQEYLSKLCFMYPNNFYAKAKYLESLANPKDFNEASREMIHELVAHENVYYRLAGYVFQGYYEEIVLHHQERAAMAYRKALSFGEKIPHHGAYFKGFGYLGLARVLIRIGDKTEAKEMLRLALKYPETERIEKEAKALLSTL